MVKVTLESVTKRFGDLVAVKDFSLEVKNKELVALLGPSGCGKTTTLRMIAGLEMMDEGNVYFDDELVNYLTPYERDVAMVFQFYVMYPRMTAFDNIAFPLKVKRIPKREIKERVKETAKLLGISHLLDKPTSRLNVAEKQRVALGRAIVRRPNVYLFDEPLTNLDVKLREGMRVEIKRLCRELGQTSIYVTHDQIEAMSIADRIAVMNLGVLQQFDQPSKLYGHPQTLFVAGFIGTPPMNFMDCSILEKDDRVILDAGTFYFDISEIGDVVKSKATSSDLILAVRPEDLSISTKQVEGSFETEVYEIEPLGSNMIADVKVGESVIKAVVPRTFTALPKDKVWASIDRDRMHIIDKKTEKVII